MHLALFGIKKEMSCPKGQLIFITRHASLSEVPWIRVVSYGLVNLLSDRGVGDVAGLLLGERAIGAYELLPREKYIEGVSRQSILM